MQYSTTIDLSSATIYAIRNNHQNKNQLFHSDLLRNKESICTMLSNYMDDRRWTVYDIRIEQTSIDIQNYRCTIPIEYDLNYYDGCKDREADDEDWMELDARIDLNLCKAVLTGEDKPERDPDFY